ncbi:MAG: signal peptidase II [Alphaproteobacteria bacterium]
MIRWGLSIAALVVLLDQASKYWVVHHVMAPPRIIEVTSFFNIVMVWNKGASFGLFSSQSVWTQALLGGLAVIISLVLVIWLTRAQNRWLALSLGLVVGGALGNAIDRAVYLAVADFLDFHVAGYHWPSFNVADIAISVGVVLLLLDGLITGRADNTLET